MQRSILERINLFKGLIETTSNSSRGQDLVKQREVLELKEATSVFEIEILCQQENWEAVELSLQSRAEVIFSGFSSV